MKINFAHLREQGINFAVFDADSPDRSASGRDAVLAQLTAKARLMGLRVDKSALAFAEHGKIQFYGVPDLVDFLAKQPRALRWTHWVDA